jgi:hypothetical protein
VWREAGSDVAVSQSDVDIAAAHAASPVVRVASLVEAVSTAAEAAGSTAVVAAGSTAVVAAMVADTAKRFTTNALGRLLFGQPFLFKSRGATAGR